MDDGPRLDDEQLVPVVEALLFVAATPLSPADLARATGTDVPQVRRALERLEERLAAGGLRLQRTGSAVQLITAPDHARWIERLLVLELSSRLSTAALETLAIIAYRQPVTRVEIDAIRGVNSSGTLRTLIQRELVEEAGRLERVGNPYLYATTDRFLQYFGLLSLDELPELEEEQVVALFRELEEVESGESGSADP